MATAMVATLRRHTPDEATSAAALAELARDLQASFGVPWAIWDSADGQCLVRPAEQPNADDAWRGEMIRQLTHCEIIAEEGPLVVVAMPLVGPDNQRLVATGTFVVIEAAADSGLAAAARLLDLHEAAACAWMNAQQRWPRRVLLQLAEAVAKRHEAAALARRAAWEVEEISANLAATYEEICLLHEMANHLRLSQSDDQLGCLALERLLTCLDAEGAAIQFLPVAHADDVTYKARVSTELIDVGQFPLNNPALSQLVDHLQLHANSAPFVANLDLTAEPDWPFPEVRQLIVVPLSESGKLFGWLAVANHLAGEEFGSIEASLVSSVGAILGIHCGNRNLYRLQDEFLASVVRAMTSAIDAKDPYTCGHSDRVARIAVRLARELGFSTDELANLYMAGLLHDVGKIGIDDHVLRKPGKLTTEEFEHVKEHPELGYKILADLKPLASVLPAVRHHHEQWDGRGYPAGLAAEEIPLIARVVAVADAYDAMISDRPYRRGMPLEKVEAIFAKGANQQWDKQVVDAYFAARDDIRAIGLRERANLSLDVTRWT